MGDSHDLVIRAATVFDGTGRAIWTSRSGLRSFGWT